MRVKPDSVAAGVPLDEEERARAGVYGLLGALLASPPQSDLLARLRDLDPGEGALAPVWQSLKLAAGKARPEQLEEEFNALFIGLGRGELVPYGSWYLTGFLMEKPLAELRVGLQQLGYARQEGVSEPEDHVAALCEVMSMTIVENKLTFSEQAAFFAKHVGSWMPRFFQDLEKAESADFYRLVGSLGTHLMTVEQQYFAMSA